MGELALSAGADARLDAAVARLGASLGDLEEIETRARGLVEQMALVLLGSLLVRHAPSAVADAFCATRLDGQGGFAFGTLPAGTDFDAILERALPEGS